MDVSVLTLSRHKPDYVERLSDALDALNLGEDPPLEVERILVNNGAPRERTTWDPVTKLACQRGWVVIEPGYNASFSEGNNLAAQAAQGEYLLLLNDDAVPESEAVARLWSARDAAEVLGCLILQDDGTVNHAGTDVLPWPDHIGRGSSLADWLPGLHDREAVTFACVLIRADWYAKLEGLDEGYVYSFEDVDFCLRTIANGGRVAVHLGAVVRHNECGTRPRGGTNDGTNAQRYRERWGETVAGIVERYRSGD